MDRGRDSGWWRGLRALALALGVGAASLNAPAQGHEDEVEAQGRWVTLPLWAPAAGVQPGEGAADGVPPTASFAGDVSAVRGWWLAAPTPAGQRQPAVLLFHGCGGMVDGSGRPTARMRHWAHWLHAQGWHVLAVDSLQPRGERSLCAQPLGSRRVGLVERGRDVWAALRWAAAQPGVDAQRLALLGWSNGGSAVLAATHRGHPWVQQQLAKGAPTPRLALAYYPGCRAEQVRGYQPLAPLVLLLGLADDWTPASPCLELAAQAPRGPVAREAVTVHAWAGAYHGFDGQAPLRLRRDVPNGSAPGQGVHVGVHPLAREQSQALVRWHLQQALGGADATSPHPADRWPVGAGEFLREQPND